MQNRRICWLFCMLVFFMACGPSRQSAYSPLNKKPPEKASANSYPVNNSPVDSKQKYEPILKQPSIDSMANSPLKPPSTYYKPKQESQIWQEFSHARNQDQSLNDESRISPIQPKEGKGPNEPSTPQVDPKKPSKDAGQEKISIVSHSTLNPDSSSTYTTEQNSKSPKPGVTTSSNH